MCKMRQKEATFQKFVEYFFHLEILKFTIQLYFLIEIIVVFLGFELFPFVKIPIKTELANNMKGLHERIKVH